MYSSVIIATYKVLLVEYNTNTLHDSYAYEPILKRNIAIGPAFACRAIAALFCGHFSYISVCCTDCLQSTTMRSATIDYVVLLAQWCAAKLHD